MIFNPLYTTLLSSVSAEGPKTVNKQIKNAKYLFSDLIQSELNGITAKDGIGKLNGNSVKNNINALLNFTMNTSNSEVSTDNANLLNQLQKIANLLDSFIENSQIVSNSRNQVGEDVIFNSVEPKEKLLQLIESLMNISDKIELEKIDNDETNSIEIKTDGKYTDTKPSGSSVAEKYTEDKDDSKGSLKLQFTKKVDNQNIVFNIIINDKKISNLINGFINAKFTSGGPEIDQLSCENNNIEKVSESGNIIKLDNNKAEKITVDDSGKLHIPLENEEKTLNTSYHLKGEIKSGNSKNVESNQQEITVEANQIKSGEHIETGKKTEQDNPLKEVLNLSSLKKVRVTNEKVVSDKQNQNLISKLNFEESANHNIEKNLPKEIKVNLEVSTLKGDIAENESDGLNIQKKIISKTVSDKLDYEFKNLNEFAKEFASVKQSLSVEHKVETLKLANASNSPHLNKKQIDADNHNISNKLQETSGIKISENAASESNTKFNSGTQNENGNRYYDGRGIIELNKHKSNIESDNNLLQTDKNISTFNMKNHSTQNTFKSLLFNNTAHDAVVDRSNLIDTITRYVKENRKESITLKLMPENLGKLKINLDMVDNKLQAHFEVANQAAKNLLQTNLDGLKNSFMTSGINLGSVNINVKNQNDRESNFQKNKKGTFSKFNIAEIDEQESLSSVKAMGYNTYEYLM